MYICAYVHMCICALHFHALTTLNLMPHKHLHSYWMSLLCSSKSTDDWTQTTIFHAKHVVQLQQQQLYNQNAEEKRTPFEMEQSWCVNRYTYACRREEITTCICSVYIWVYIHTHGKISRYTYIEGKSEREIYTYTYITQCMYII